MDGRRDSGSCCVVKKGIIKHKEDGQREETMFKETLKHNFTTTWWAVVAVCQETTAAEQQTQHRTG